MNASARARLNLVFGEATGSALVQLTIALQQRMFEKQSLEVEPVSAPGVTVPRITSDAPVGLIGEPATILQVVEGSDLRIITSLSSTPLSGHLVARPEIKLPGEMRDTCVGVAGGGNRKCPS
jgi:hypothetical protein